MKVNNIFNLLGRIHQEEDRVTVAFGYILSNSNHLFKWFMNKIGFSGNFSTRDFNFDTQQFELNINDINRTDLIISNEDYYIIVESKIRENNFREKQLLRYYNMAYNRLLRNKKIKIVLITQIDEESRFYNFIKKEKLESDKVFYFRWLQIQDEIKDKVVGRMLYSANQFIEYLGDEMYDETEIRECKIKDIDEIAVFSVDDDTIKNVLSKTTASNEYAYFQSQTNVKGRPRVTGDAQYIAFYQQDPIFAITHISKIIRTRMNVPSKETTDPTYWNRDFYYGYYFKKPKKLVHPIENPQESITTINKKKKNWRFRVGNPTYTSFSKLLSAKNVKEALSN